MRFSKPSSLHVLIVCNWICVLCQGMNLGSSDTKRMKDLLVAVNVNWRIRIFTFVFTPSSKDGNYLELYLRLMF